MWFEVQLLQWTATFDPGAAGPVVVVYSARQQPFGQGTRLILPSIVSVCLERDLLVHGACLVARLLAFIATGESRTRKHSLRT